MQKDKAIKLKEYAEIIAVNFSRKDREFNFNKETFSVKKIIPLSESTAGVVYQKNTGKLALYFCYWINMNSGMWQGFFITDSHVVGLVQLDKMLSKVEQHNFDLNF